MSALHFARGRDIHDVNPALIEVVEKPQSAAEVRALAEAWYRQQVETARQALGASWPEHKAWVIDYLKQEVRQKLIARGWRPRNG